MRTPKITAKRALGLTAAVALAVTGTVAAAGTSQAAVSALKLSTVTFSEDGGTIVTVTGKDFQNAAGTDKIGAVWFEAGATGAACDYANRATNAANFNVVSATKLTATAPDVQSVTLGTVTTYQLCISAGTDVVGAGKITANPSPTITAVSSTEGPTLGGTSVTITGGNYTTKTTATIGGKSLTGVKVVVDKVGNVDTLTGVVPANSLGTKKITVTSEGGSVTHGTDFTYRGAVKVAPVSGDGATGRVITMTGLGFKDKTFAATPANNSSVVALTVPGSAVPVAGGALPASGTGTRAAVFCTDVKVVSDTELNCKLPNLNGTTNPYGTYALQIVDFGAASPTATAATAVSRSAVYTAAAF